MDIDQQRAVLTLCLMAAFADGVNSDAERAEILILAADLPRLWNSSEASAAIRMSTTANSAPPTSACG